MDIHSKSEFRRLMVVAPEQVYEELQRLRDENAKLVVMNATLAVERAQFLLDKVTLEDRLAKLTEGRDERESNP